MKIDIDPTRGYHYPDKVLKYRAIVPEDIKKDIR